MSEEVKPQESPEVSKEQEPTPAQYMTQNKFSMTIVIEGQRAYEMSVPSGVAVEECLVVLDEFKKKFEEIKVSLQESAEAKAEEPKEEDS